MEKERILTILGSAAAEGIPALFCNCDVCKYSWEHGGKDRRMRASYQLGDAVRIDFGPDHLAQEYQYKLHSELLKHLFITHSHCDHFVPEDLDFRRPGMSRVDADNILNLYGGCGVIRKLNISFWNGGRTIGFHGDYAPWRLAPHRITAGEKIELPDQDMTFVAIPADHMQGIPTEEPFCYAIRWGSKHLLIANDTGFFQEEAWKIFAEINWQFDLVICDATCGVLESPRGHMGGQYPVKLRDHMAANNWLAPGARFCVNHFSHNGSCLQSTLEELYSPFGIEVGYDGMTFEF